MTKAVYLDYAAATPMDESVFLAMKPYFTERFYNPSATYLNAKQVSRDVEQARQQVSSLLGVRPAEVIFTAGGTEANNLAISGIMQKYPKGHVVVSSVEHDSVSRTAQQYDHSLLSVKEDGRIKLDELGKIIRDETVLVSIMYVNNELGTVMPLRKVAKIIADIRDDRRKRNVNTPLYFHTDACQAGLYLDIHCARLGVDMMTLNGGKMYGPKQSGALYVETGTQLEPIIRGGGQEWGKRSGTENVAGIVGFACALRSAIENQKDHNPRLIKLQDTFIRGLTSISTDITVNGSTQYRTPNNVHITIPGYDNERIMMELDEDGVMCAVGSACSASNDEPSHVLKAIGLSDQEAQSSLRFTFGKSTTQSDIEYTLEVLKKRLQAHA